MSIRSDHHPDIGSLRFLPRAFKGSIIRLSRDESSYHTIKDSVVAGEPASIVWMPTSFYRYFLFFSLPLELFFFTTRALRNDPVPLFLPPSRRITSKWRDVKPVIEHGLVDCIYLSKEEVDIQYGSWLTLKRLKSSLFFSCILYQEWKIWRISFGLSLSSLSWFLNSGIASMRVHPSADRYESDSHRIFFFR